MPHPAVRGFEVRSRCGFERRRARGWRVASSPGEVKSDLAGLALNHHVENLPVLGHLYPTGALGELDQRFIAVKSGSARQRRTGRRTVAAAADVLAVSERQAYRLLA
jgi:hypothetical protein